MTWFLFLFLCFFSPSGSLSFQVQLSSEQIFCRSRHFLISKFVILQQWFIAAINIYLMPKIDKLSFGIN